MEFRSLSASSQALVSAEDGPNTPPSGLTLQNVAGRSFRLKWNPPVGANLPVDLQYIVFYKADDNAT